MTAVTDVTGDKATCVEALKQMATGSVEDIAELFGPEATNREAKDEPPATRGKGPEAIYATALWLREAHADLRWDVHDAVQEGELVVLHATMSGGNWVVHRLRRGRLGEDGLPPDRPRLLRHPDPLVPMKDGKIAEHWANRDDRTMGEQLGWNPPNPIYLAKNALARRRARQAAKR